MLFTVEIASTNSDRPRVEIFLDEDGIKLLLRRLEFIKNGKSHDHFMTPSWAGNELTEVKVGGPNVLVNMLNIRYVPPNFIPKGGIGLIDSIKVFSIEIERHGSETPIVEMFLDESALGYLMDVVRDINETKGGHRFMTPNCGGWELTERKMDNSNVLVNQLDIKYVSH